MYISIEREREIEPWRRRVVLRAAEYGGKACPEGRQRSVEPRHSLVELHEQSY